MFITRIKQLKTTRIVAFAVALLFTHQQIAWAQGARQVPMQKVPEVQMQQYLPKQIDVPYDLARKYGAYKGEKEELVINIQDAHASISAQRSIVDTLEVLANNYDLEFVSVEGAQGYIDTSILKTCPDKDIKRDTADFLMTKGLMNAGEFFAVTSDKNDVLLYGAEDNELYQKNRESFKKIFEIGQKIIPEIERLILVTQSKSDQVFGNQLKSFMGVVRAHREGRLNFREYWQKILSFNISKDINKTEERQLAILLEAISKEEQIDFNKANAERTKLIAILTRQMEEDELEEVVAKSTSFKEKKISPGAFHSFLIETAKSKGIDLSPFSDLQKYTEYINLYESVDVFRAQQQMQQMESIIADFLCKTEIEKKLFELERFLYLAKQAFTIQASNRDIFLLKENIAEYNPDHLSKVRLFSDYDMSYLIEKIKEAIGFYHDAEKRNRAMVDNTLSLMRKENKKVAALISGGYHSEGLVELLRNKKVSYLVLAPQFEQGQKRPYITILTGRNEFYRQIKDSHDYKIASSGCFYGAKGDLEKLGSGLYFALASARLRGKKHLEDLKNEWIKAYEMAYRDLISNKERVEQMDFDPVPPKEFRMRMQYDLDVIKRGTKAFVLLNRDVIFSAKDTGEKIIEDKVSPAEKEWIEQELTRKDKVFLRNDFFEGDIFTNNDLFGKNVHVADGYYKAEVVDILKKRELSEDFNKAYQTIVSWQKQAKTTKEFLKYHHSGKIKALVRKVRTKEERQLLVLVINNIIRFLSKKEEYQEDYRRNRIRIIRANIRLAGIKSRTKAEFKEFAETYWATTIKKPVERKIITRQEEIDSIKRCIKDTLKRAENRERAFDEIDALTMESDSPEKFSWYVQEREIERIIKDHELTGEDEKVFSYYVEAAKVKLRERLQIEALYIQMQKWKKQALLAHKETPYDFFIRKKPPLVDTLDKLWYTSDQAKEKVVNHFDEIADFLQEEQEHQENIAKAHFQIRQIGESALKQELPLEDFITIESDVIKIAHKYGLLSEKEIEGLRNHFFSWAEKVKNQQMEKRTKALKEEIDKWYRQALSEGWPHLQFISKQRKTEEAIIGLDESRRQEVEAYFNEKAEVILDRNNRMSRVIDSVSSWAEEAMHDPVQRRGLYRKKLEFVKKAEEAGLGLEFDKRQVTEHFEKQALRVREELRRRKNIASVKAVIDTWYEEALIGYITCDEFNTCINIVYDLEEDKGLNDVKSWAEISRHFKARQQKLLRIKNIRKQIDGWARSDINGSLSYAEFYSKKKRMLNTFMATYSIDGAMERDSLLRYFNAKAELIREKRAIEEKRNATAALLAKMASALQKIRLAEEERKLQEKEKVAGYFRVSQEALNKQKEKEAVLFIKGKIDQWTEQAISMEERPEVFNRRLHQLRVLEGQMNVTSASSRQQLRDYFAQKREELREANRLTEIKKEVRSYFIKNKIALRRMRKEEQEKASSEQTIDPVIERIEKWNREIRTAKDFKAKKKSLDSFVMNLPAGQKTTAYNYFASVWQEKREKEIDRFLERTLPKLKKILLAITAAVILGAIIVINKTELAGSKITFGVINEMIAQINDKLFTFLSGIAVTVLLWITVLKEEGLKKINEQDQSFKSLVISLEKDDKEGLFFGAANFFVQRIVLGFFAADLLPFTSAAMIGAGLFYGNIGNIFIGSILSYAAALLLIVNLTLNKERTKGILLTEPSKYKMLFLGAVVGMVFASFVNHLVYLVPGINPAQAFIILAALSSMLLIYKLTVQIKQRDGKPENLWGLAGLILGVALTGAFAGSFTERIAKQKKHHTDSMPLSQSLREKAYDKWHGIVRERQSLEHFKTKVRLANTQKQLSSIEMPEIIFMNKEKMHKHLEEEMQARKQEISQKNKEEADKLWQLATSSLLMGQKQLVRTLFPEAEVTHRNFLSHLSRLKQISEDENDPEIAGAVKALEAAFNRTLTLPMMDQRVYRYIYTEIEGVPDRTKEEMVPVITSLLKYSAGNKNNNMVAAAELRLVAPSLEEVPQEIMSAINRAYLEKPSRRWSYHSFMPTNSSKPLLDAIKEGFIKLDARDDKKHKRAHWGTPLEQRLRKIFGDDITNMTLGDFIKHVVPASWVSEHYKRPRGILINVQYGHPGEETGNYYFYPIHELRELNKNKHFFKFERTIGNNLFFLYLDGYAPKVPDIGSRLKGICTNDVINALRVITVAVNNNVRIEHSKYQLPDDRNVMALKVLLREIGYPISAINGIYDKDVIKAVRDLAKSNGKVVGPRTIRAIRRYLLSRDARVAKKNQGPGFQRVKATRQIPAGRDEYTFNARTFPGVKRQVFYPRRLASRSIRGKSTSFGSQKGMTFLGLLIPMALMFIAALAYPHLAGAKQLIAVALNKETVPIGSLMAILIFLGGMILPVTGESGAGKGTKQIAEKNFQQRPSRDIQQNGVLYRVYGENLPRKALKEITSAVEKDKEQFTGRVPSYLHALFLDQHLAGAKIIGTKDARKRSEEIHFPSGWSFLAGSLYGYQHSYWLTCVQLGDLHVAIYPSPYKSDEKADPDCVLFVENSPEGLEKTLIQYMGGTSWKFFDEWFSFERNEDKDEENLISRFVKYVPTRSRIDHKKGTRVFTNVEPDELKGFLIKRRWMGPRMPYKDDDSLYDDVELFVMSVTGRAMPRFFGPFTGVLSELESNAKVRGKGLSDWQMFLYEAKNKEGQVRWFFRYRLFQDGISETNERGITHPMDHWARLGINAIEAARYEDKNYLFLQGVANQDRDDISVVRKLGEHYVGYGNGLKEMGLFMKYSKLFVLYEKQPDGRIKTDAWFDVTEMLSEDQVKLAIGDEAQARPVVVERTPDPLALKAMEMAQRKALREKVRALACKRKAMLLFRMDNEKETVLWNKYRKNLFKDVLKAIDKIINDDFRPLEYYSEYSFFDIADNQSIGDIFEAIVYEEVISEEVWHADEGIDYAILVFLPKMLHQLFMIPQTFRVEEKGENLLFYEESDKKTSLLRAIYDTEGNQISSFEYDNKTNALVSFSTLNLETADEIQCLKVSEEEYEVLTGQRKIGELRLWRPKSVKEDSEYDRKMSPIQVALYLNWDIHHKGVGESVLNALMHAMDEKTYVYDDNVFNPAMFRLSNKVCKQLKLFNRDEWILISKKTGAYRFLNEFVLVDPKLRYRDYEIRPYLDSGTRKTGHQVLRFRVMAYYSEQDKKVVYKIQETGKAKKKKSEQTLIFIHPENGKKVKISIEKQTIVLKYEDGSIVRDLGVFYKDPLIVDMAPDPVLMSKTRHGSIYWHKAGERIRVIPAKVQKAEKERTSKGAGSKKILGLLTAIVLGDLVYPFLAGAADKSADFAAGTDPIFLVLGVLGFVAGSLLAIRSFFKIQRSKGVNKEDPDIIFIVPKELYAYLTEPGGTILYDRCRQMNAHIVSQGLVESLKDEAEKLLFNKLDHDKKAKRVTITEHTLVKRLGQHEEVNYDLAWKMFGEIARDERLDRKDWVERVEKHPSGRIKTVFHKNGNVVEYYDEDWGPWGRLANKWYMAPAFLARTKEYGKINYSYSKQAGIYTFYKYYTDEKDRKIIAVAECEEANENTKQEAIKSIFGKKLVQKSYSEYTLGSKKAVAYGTVFFAMQIVAGILAIPLLVIFKVFAGLYNLFFPGESDPSDQAGPSKEKQPAALDRLFRLALLFGSIFIVGGYYSLKKNGLVDPLRYKQHFYMSLSAVAVIIVIGVLRQVIRSAEEQEKKYTFEEEDDEEVAPAPYKLYLALPLDLALKRGIRYIAEKRGIDIIRLGNQQGEALVKELVNRKLAKRDKRSFCMLLDKEAMEEMNLLMPDGSINRKNLITMLDTFVFQTSIEWFKETAHITEERKMYGAAKIFATTLPRIEPELLAEKSLHEILIDSIHWKHAVEGQTMEREEKDSIADSLLEKNGKILSIPIKNAADMRFLANALEDIGINKRLASKILHIRLISDDITNDNMDAYLEETGLNKYIDRKNIEFCTDDENISSIIEGLQTLFGDSVLTKEVIIGSSEFLVKEDEDMQTLIDHENIKLLQMLKGSEGRTDIVSRLFLNMVRLMAKGDEIVNLVPEVEQSDVFSRWYILYPSMDQVQWQEAREEIDRYNRYINSKA